MVQTTKVFTPTKTPTYTSVRRAALWDELGELVDQGGAFVPVIGVTKLGKTTLIKNVMERGDHIYIPAQDLLEGTAALWSQLATALDLPTSTTTGKVTGDKSTWGFFSKFGVKVPGFGVDAGGKVGGEKNEEKSHTSTHDVELSVAVKDALKLLSEHASEHGLHPPVVVLDDFHFVTDTATRKQILLAMRPIMENDATLILASLPGREHDPAYTGTNLDGRLTPIAVPRWTSDELRQIATRGFETLKVAAQPGVIDQLIEQSYGSPQIMQRLCLQLCRFNGVKDDNSGVGVLDSPADWRDFFRELKDSQSVKWLERLGLGLLERGTPRNRAVLPDGRKFDGYQLILWAIHEMGSPAEVPFTTVTGKIASLLGVSSSDLRTYALEAKAKNMNTVATRDMKDALAKQGATDDGTADEEATFSTEEIEMAELIPQPVFEVSGEKAAEMILRIQNPLLAYALTWHPESFETSPKS